jgi:hypothetical protein
MQLSDPQFDESISLRRAYFATFEFLRRHYERGPTDVAFVLSQLQTLQNGSSADPATLHDWLEAVRTVMDAEAKPGGYREIEMRLSK